MRVWQGMYCTPALDALKGAGTPLQSKEGSKGRAANGDRPVGAASCRRDRHTMASCQNPLQSEVVAFGLASIVSGHGSLVSVR